MQTYPNFLKIKTFIEGNSSKTTTSPIIKNYIYYEEKVKLKN